MFHVKHLRGDKMILIDENKHSLIKQIQKSFKCVTYDDAINLIINEGIKTLLNDLDIAIAYDLCEQEKVVD